MTSTLAELDGRRVPEITAYLAPQGPDVDPARLIANRGKAFSGGYPYGAGFTFDDTNKDAWPTSVLHTLLDASPGYGDYVHRYIGGEEMLNSPRQQPHRYVIDFGDMSLKEAQQWPELLRLLEQRVKPEREKLPNNNDGIRRKTYWWLWGRTTPALDIARKHSPRVLMHPFTSSHVAFAFIDNDVVIGSPHPAITLASNQAFGILQSRVHEAWVRSYASSLKDDLRYTPSDCFETFPFPENFETDPALEAAGKEYYEYRAALMVEHDEGLTKTYNRFHDPAESNEKILRLRELHAAMDRAVLDAYRWNDVPTACGFALDWLDLDDDELADTLASAPDDIRERIESADYFFPDAAAACRFQSHIKKDGKGKLPWRYRWPDEVRDDVLARLLSLNAKRAELERLTGLAGATSKTVADADADSDSFSVSDTPPRKARLSKKASKRVTKKAAPRPLLNDDT